MYFLSFISVALDLLILGFYRKKHVKLEESENYVAWSDQEPDKEAADNVVDATSIDLED